MADKGDGAGVIESLSEQLPINRTRTTGFWLLIALLALVAAGKVIQADTLDPDAFWHLRVADQLLAEGIHPIVDRISFASIKEPWTPYSWLGELLMHRVWSVGGFRGAMLLTAISSAAIVALIAASCRAHGQSQNDLGIALCTAIGAFFTLPFISFRPVTFSLVILALIVWLLIRDRHRPTRWVWLCVPLSIVETNVHLYAFIGAALACLSALGAWFEGKPDVKRRVVLAALVCLAICFTPMLPGIIATAWRYNAVDPMVASNYITEMRPFYSGTIGKVSLVLLIVTLAVCVRNHSKLTITDWLWIALGTVLLFRLGRFSPVFAIVAMPCLARAMPPMRGNTLRKPLILWTLIAVLVAGSVSVAAAYPWKMPLEPWLNRNNATYPTAAAAFVDGNVTPDSKQLINEFNWGGYLAWRLGDRYQVLMDGRTQLYPPEFWRQTHLGNTAARTAFLKNVRADAAILPTHDSALAPSLIDLGWQAAYHDDLAQVLLPPVTASEQTPR